MGGGPRGPFGSHMGGAMGGPVGAYEDQLIGEMQRSQQGPPTKSSGSFSVKGFMRLFSYQQQQEGQDTLAAATAAAVAAQDGPDDPYENEPPLLEGGLGVKSLGLNSVP